MQLPYSIIGRLLLHAPRVHAKSRAAVRRTRRWFADSPKAETLALVAPAAMLGRNLDKAPAHAPGNEASRRLNRLAAGLPARSTYLEIGVAAGATLEAVDMPFKWGVDPMPKFNTHALPPGCRFACQTSDDFFAHLEPHVRFDLAFIDGLHEWHQTYTDLMNCLAHAHPHTVVLLDDVIPIDEFASWPDMDAALTARHATGNMSAAWQGNVYKTLFALRDHHPELEFRVIADGVNAQAVIWGPRGFEGVAPRASRDHYTELNFSSVFGDGGPPAWFGCLSEDEVLAAVQATGRSPRERRP